MSTLAAMRYEYIDRHDIHLNPNHALNLNSTVCLSVLRTLNLRLTVTLIPTMLPLQKYPTAEWVPNSKTDLQAAIIECLKLSDDCSKSPHGPIRSWDVSTVTDMSLLLYFAEGNKFTGDVSEWDVASVTDMNNMFSYASSFNGDISKWDVSRVTNMVGMFSYASLFNGDISKWDVSTVTAMPSMFENAKSFNGDLSNWDVSSVTSMNSMFLEAKAFAQTLCGAWSTSTANGNKMFDGSSGRICTPSINSNSKTTSLKTLTLT